MTKKKMDLKDLAHELDHTVGGINLATETLEDISTNPLHVMEDMDNVPDGMDLRLYFREWHREIRILAKLMGHATDDLSKNKADLRNLSENIFDKVVRD